MTDLTRKLRNIGNFRKIKTNLHKHKKCLSAIKNTKCKTESDVCTILALHLFGPLVDGDYKIEGGPTRKRRCYACQRELKVGDTSFGNKTVWHGRADIMLRSSVVKVDIKGETNEVDSDEENAVCRSFNENFTLTHDSGIYSDYIYHG